MAVEPEKDFVDVRRTFFRVDGTKPIKADEIEAWAHWGGSTKWEDLLKLRRVVVLAEANSGKTQEFRNQVSQITKSGGFAFFLAIEVLARNDFAIAMGRDQVALFQQWKDQAVQGFFFLDSLDEAKLNQLSLETALRELQRQIGGAYDRVHLIVSSRGTDWDGSRDANSMLECLPPSVDTEELAGADEDEALVSAIRRKGGRAAEKKVPDQTVAVFAMARLTRDQREIFLRNKKFGNIEAFETALFRHGIIPMSERPGDLAMLLQYWRNNGDFGSLREMMEYSVERRLSERSGRKDASLLSGKEARKGAERLAATLTLSKRLTIISDEDAGEATDTLDAINPNLVLSDWTADKIRALLRRGIFAPSTFGRIRFHHRSVVEFLSASWFTRILKGPQSPARKVLDVITSRGFDLLTVPPSLRPVAAWLALDFPQLLEILVEQDPLALFAFGDPTQLSVADRARLLNKYAQKDALGAVSDLLIDAHALWMFSDPKLAPCLTDAWDHNKNSDFRFDLLRLIELGKLTDCSASVRSVALDPAAPNDNRIMAARALGAIKDEEGQRLLARDLLDNAATYSPRLSPGLALTLYPTALTTDELIAIIAVSPPARQFQVEGFGYALERLYAACTTAEDRNKLIKGLVVLGAQPPLEQFQHVSEAHTELFKHCAPMLRRSVIASDLDGVSEELVSLLAIAGRVDVDEAVDPGQPLRDLVNSRRWLKRKLFWEDVCTTFEREPDVKSQPYVWWIHTAGRRLWTLDEGDLGWLQDDAQSEMSEPRKRTAFSAAYQIGKSRPENLEQLRRRFTSQHILMADLEQFETPRKESEVEQRMRLRREEIETAQRQEFEKNAESWRVFRAELRGDSGRLNDRSRMVGWPGANYLYDLTRWLALKTGAELTKAPKEHVKLLPAFGSEVHAAYIEGMNLIWRETEPTRPVHDANGRTSINKTAQLSVGGINLESMTPGWNLMLTPELLRRAIEHAVFMERDAPEWFETFLVAAPPEALAVIANELREEWKRPSNQPASFLSRFAHGIDAPEFLRDFLIQLIREVEVADPGRVRDLSYLVLKQGLTATERKSLAPIVRARLDGYRAAGEWEWSASYIGFYFNLDIDEATKILPVLVSEQAEELRRERTLGLVASLFSMSSGIVGSFDRAQAATLKHLLLLTYGFVDPANDVVHEGIYSSDVRDDAQDGRSRVLSALVGSGTADAYRALLDLAQDPRICGKARRFKQIATGMAEKASERPPWKEREVEAFEDQLLSPVRTSSELLRLACEIIDDIENEFQTWDFSIKPLLETAEDEFAVQNWLAREFRRFANGRYSAAREKHAKNEKRPDIALTALQSGFEVAIEVKHGGKEWTLTDLKDSVRRQLGEDYLLPLERRAGLFIISNHRETRFWYSDDRKVRLSFSDVVEELTAVAAEMKENSQGYIELAVRGLDASSNRPKKVNARRGRQVSRIASKIPKARKVPKSHKKSKANKKPNVRKRIATKRSARNQSPK